MPSSSFTETASSDITPYFLPPSPGGRQFADKAVSAGVNRDTSTTATSFPTVALEPFQMLAPADTPAGDEISETPITEHPDIGSPTMQTSDLSAKSPREGSEAACISLGTTILAPRPVHPPHFVQASLTTPSTPTSAGQASIPQRGLIVPELGPVSIPLPPLSPLPDDNARTTVVHVISPDVFDEPYVPSPVTPSYTSSVEPASRLSTLPDLISSSTGRRAYGSGVNLVIMPELSKQQAEPPSFTVTLPTVSGGCHVSCNRNETVMPEDNDATRADEVKYIVVTAGYRVGVFRNREYAAPYVRDCPGAQYEEYSTYATALGRYREARSRHGVWVIEKTPGM
ncbi:hypothetical protein C8Q79DRAFT_927257 [Trametes meyenii]|nr:hypothetical protein C8Q79DRAFT_927257 [Trametes meyenii]